jgi:two-component system chemotaxis sensor kinase CheA
MMGGYIDMDKDQLIQELMPTFLTELDELVRALNQDLLALENAPTAASRRDPLTKLFRTAHSLKGAARTVNIAIIESTCHRLEDILAAVREERLVLDATLIQLLFKTADAITEAAARLRGKQDLASAALADLPALLDGVIATRSNPRVANQASTTIKPSAASLATAPSTAQSGESIPVADDAARLPAPDLATVRVPAAKLDELLAQSGELLVARRRVQARTEELAVLRDVTTRLKADWHALQKPLRLSLSIHQNGRGRHGGPRPLASGIALAKDSKPTMTRHEADRFCTMGDRLARLEMDFGRLVAGMTEDVRSLHQAAGRLDHEVDRVRMLPFAQGCQGLDRVVRDLAQACGKEVELVIQSGNVELDRSILEELRAPLLHLIRNAVDHGIEMPHKREAAGKPRRGQIVVAAALSGSQVEIIVADDGQGLDVEALREQALKRGFSGPADDEQLIRLVFQPGFSTARIITDVSGRGVGLDVVKSRVESLLGTVDLASEVGRGVRFRLSVPLTLTTLQVVMTEAGGQVHAIAAANVQQMVRLSAADFRSVEGRLMVALDGRPVPVASLAETLGLRARLPAPSNAKFPAIVVAAGKDRLAFLVDELVAKQEIVVKTLGARIRRLKHVSGATLLPSGRIALVLNVPNLIMTALGRAFTCGLALAADEKSQPPKKRLLAVEDSVTTRSLVKSILEGAGYEVAVAVDGEAAWRLLQDQGADLVVSDVEMPRMDGFALTEMIRGSKRFRDLPVVLVTARENEFDKARGAQVGADAYLVKSAFDQRNLLETIMQLV